MPCRSLAPEHLRCGPSRPIAVPRFGVCSRTPSVRTPWRASGTAGVVRPTAGSSAVRVSDATRAGGGVKTGWARFMRAALRCYVKSTTYAPIRGAQIVHSGGGASPQRIGGRGKGPRTVVREVATHRPEARRRGLRDRSRASAGVGSETRPARFRARDRSPSREGDAFRAVRPQHGRGPARQGRAANVETR